MIDDSNRAISNHSHWLSHTLILLILLTYLTHLHTVYVGVSLWHTLHKIWYISIYSWAILLLPVKCTLYLYISLIWTVWTGGWGRSKHDQSMSNQLKITYNTVWTVGWGRSKQCMSNQLKITYNIIPKNVFINIIYSQIK